MKHITQANADDAVNNSGNQHNRTNDRTQESCGNEARSRLLGSALLSVVVRCVRCGCLCLCLCSHTLHGCRSSLLPPPFFSWKEHRQNVERFRVSGGVVFIFQIRWFSTTQTLWLFFIRIDTNEQIAPIEWLRYLDNVYYFDSIILYLCECVFHNYFIHFVGFVPPQGSCGRHHRITKLIVFISSSLNK